MANDFPKLIIPDDEIARIALKYWPEPTKYQATVMMTIALMESDGDARAWYYNVEGDFAETFDRGLWGINEGAIARLRSNWYQPEDFANPDANGEMARVIWDWRYAQKASFGSAVALPFAYTGWTTYRKARVEKDPEYVKAWDIKNARAIKATGWKK